MAELNPNRDAQPFWRQIRARHVFTIAVLVALAALFVAARDDLGPYILGIVMAYFLLPVVRHIESWIPKSGRLASARRPIATILTVLLTIGGAILLFSLLAQPITEETQELADNFPAYWEDLTDGETLGDWYVDNVPAETQAWLSENIGKIGQSLLDAAAGVLAYFFSATGNVLSAVAAFAIVPIFMAYVLIDRPRAKARMQTMLPEAWVDDTFQTLRLADGIMASYTRGVILSSVVVGVITGFGYWVIGVELWLALAVVAFLGEIVPILGPWIAFLISFPVILATQPDKAIPAMVVFGIIQALEGWFISPRIQGKSIELPSSVVLVSLAIGGAVGGAIGVVLALPLVAIFRAIVVYTMRRLDGIRPDVASIGLLPDSQTPTEVKALDSPAPS